MIGMFVPGSRRWRSEPTPEHRAAAGRLADGWCGTLVASERWWVCRVRGDRQLVFLEECRRFAVEAYTPLHEVRVRVTGKRRPQVTVRCTYPGYVFVPCAADMRVVASASGWVGHLMFGGVAQSVGRRVMASMHQMELDETRRVEREAEPLGVGERVKVVAGWLEGQSGTIIRAQHRSARAYAVVELDDRPGMSIEFSSFVLDRI